MADTATTTTTVEKRGTRKERVGDVISNKMTKTIVVRVQRRFPHPRFKKVVTAYSKFYAHDEKAEAKVDYFATSLPTMLLFDDDLRFRQETTALFLRAQSLLGLGKKREAQQLLALVLKRDPNHASAADLSSAPPT